jgi:hypothetical protein
MAGNHPNILPTPRRGANPIPSAGVMTHSGGTRPPDVFQARPEVALHPMNLNVNLAITVTGGQLTQKKTSTTFRLPHA